MSDAAQEAVLEPNPLQGSLPDNQARENCHLTEFSKVKVENEETASPDGKSDRIPSPALETSDSISQEKEFDELDYEAPCAEDEDECVPESNKLKESSELCVLPSLDEDGDDGECSDGELEEDEDLEEGELKDGGDTHMIREDTKQNKPTKQVCRFFRRGTCFFGVNCQFLHVNAPGSHYSMFSGTPVPRVPAPCAPAPRAPEFFGRGMNICHRPFFPRRSVVPYYFAPEPTPVPLPALTQFSESSNSAWERGLRHAKELLNKKERDRRESFFREPPRSKERYGDDRSFYPELPSSKARYRSVKEEKEVLEEVPSCLNAGEFFDPWRRSKSPEGNARRERKTRSRSGSFSTLSSYSYSSYSRSSSRSSSRSRTPSISGSRSPCRSSPPISMDSVSSASSIISNSSGSTLHSPNSKHSPSRKTTENKTRVLSEHTPPMIKEERDLLEEGFQMNTAQHRHTMEVCVHPFPSLHHLLPSNDDIEEPSKSAPNKQHIKLTLINRNTEHKLHSLSKGKGTDVNRKITDESSKRAAFYVGVKGRLYKSPSLAPVATKPMPVLVPKKDSSRRDQLLKQLKAVEDAIARKRAKFD